MDKPIKQSQNGTQRERERERKDLDDQEIAERAGKQVVAALQRIIPTHQSVTVSNIKLYRSEIHKESHKEVAERLLALWREDLIVVQTKKIILGKQGTKDGKIITIVSKRDVSRLISSILEYTIAEDAPLQGKEQSVLTETINIIGNAFVSEVADQYGWSIGIGVPGLMNAQDFDAALVSLVSTESEMNQKAYECKLTIGNQQIIVYLFIFINL